jgi:hypothetical protein
MPAAYWRPLVGHAARHQVADRAIRQAARLVHRHLGGVAGADRGVGAQLPVGADRDGVHGALEVSQAIVAFELVLVLGQAVHADRLQRAVSHAALQQFGHAHGLAGIRAGGVQLSSIL